MKRLCNYTPGGDIRIRAREDGESRVIEGYAIVFNRESEVMWRDCDGYDVVEEIAPEAISESLLRASDIKLTMYHDFGRLLGRSKKGKGSLSWSVDDHGVRFECEMPNTTHGDEALDLVRRGDIDGCSFMFSTKYGDKDYVSKDIRDGKVVYRVNKITRLYDFTLTPDPAYPQTECDVRTRAIGEAEPEAPEAPTPEETHEENTHEENIEEPNNNNMEENTPTPAPSEELNAIQQERALDERIQRAVARVNTTSNPFADADTLLRRGRAERFDVTVRFTRDIMTTAGVADTGIIPVSENEILKPIREGLIWDKVGLNVQSGLAGTLRWPTHSKATATWEDETSKLVDSKIDFSKLTMQGKRLGLAIPVSKTELNDSHGIVERAVREEMPEAVSELINSSMLTLYADYEHDDEVFEKAVHGPWAQSAKRPADNCAIVQLAANITRKNLLDMKAKVAATGIALSHPIWACNETTKAALEDTKVDAGSGRFLCEGDQIFGAPVFTSNEIPDGVVLFGDFSYQAAGFFGQMDMTIDPYTLARQHSTDFVLNMRFGTATLRKEAFVVGMTPSAKTAFDTALAKLAESAS